MGADLPGESDKKIKEICAQYKTEQITKDEALDRLGLKDEVQANTVDGSIDTDELIYDICDPAAAKDRGDVEDGIWVKVLLEACLVKGKWGDGFWYYGFWALSILFRLVTI